MDNISHGNFVVYRPDGSGLIRIEYDDGKNNDSVYIHYSDIKNLIDRHPRITPKSERHQWKDGWICEKCGLRRSDYNPGIKCKQ